MFFTFSWVSSLPSIFPLPNSSRTYVYLLLEEKIDYKEEGEEKDYSKLSLEEALKQIEYAWSYGEWFGMNELGYKNGLYSLIPSPTMANSIQQLVAYPFTSPMRHI